MPTGVWERSGQAALQYLLTGRSEEDSVGGVVVGQGVPEPLVRLGVGARVADDLLERKGAGRLGGRLAKALEVAVVVVLLRHLVDLLDEPLFHVALRAWLLAVLFWHEGRGLLREAEAEVQLHHARVHLLQAAAALLLLLGWLGLLPQLQLHRFVVALHELQLLLDLSVEERLCRSSRSSATAAARL